MILLHKVLLNILMMADLCFSSRFYLGVAPELTQRLLLSSILIISVFYLSIALLRGHVIPILIYVLAVTLVCGQMIVFSINFSADINWNTAAQYSVFLSFMPVFVASRDGISNYIVKRLSVYAYAYVSLYIFYSIGNQFNLLPAQLTRPLILNDVERGERLFSYAGALAYAWFVSIKKLRNFNVINFVLFTMTAAANLLTISRVYLLCLGIVTAMSLINFKRSTIRTVCLLSLVVVSLTLLYGLVDARWNPFFQFAGTDSSGLGRALEYDIARELISQSPILGYGVAVSPDFVVTLTGLGFFAGSDLGAVGLVLDYGIIGLLLYFVCALISTSYIPKLGWWADPLFLKGSTLSIYGCIAPVLFAPGGVFYFAALFGIWLSQELNDTKVVLASSLADNSKLSSIPAAPPQTR